MSTYTEALHPRGQAANAGQFRAKINTAPDGALAPGTAPVAVDARVIERRGGDVEVGTSIFDARAMLDTYTLSEVMRMRDRGDFTQVQKDAAEYGMAPAPTDGSSLEIRSDVIGRYIDQRHTSGADAPIHKVPDVDLATVSSLLEERTEQLRKLDEQRKTLATAAAAKIVRSRVDGVHMVINQPSRRLAVFDPDYMIIRDLPTDVEEEIRAEMSARGLFGSWEID